MRSGRSRTSRSPSLLPPPSPPLQVRDLYCDPRAEPDVWKTPLGALYLDGPIHVFRHPAVLKVPPVPSFRRRFYRA